MYAQNHRSHKCWHPRSATFVVTTPYSRFSPLPCKTDGNFLQWHKPHPLLFNPLPLSLGYPSCFSQGPTRTFHVFPSHSLSITEVVKATLQSSQNPLPKTPELRIACSPLWSILGSQEPTCEKQEVLTLFSALSENRKWWGLVGLPVLSCTSQDPTPAAGSC